ncbi:MAG TPA: ATP synthase F1 subunit delta, partial [Planctomycetota bacterium]|nr:ATP synthase F1 subunit delta [Planctomycetota bacterium]
MADERTLARRYARALLGVAEERKEIDRVETDLREFAQTWHAAPELRTLMGHPSVPREKKKDALETALKGKVSDLTIRFLALLLEKSRLEIIEDVAEQFGEAAD